MKILRNAMIVAALAVTGAAYADHHKTAGTIVSVAEQAGSFETLLTALQAAGLAETLKGEGPFTVFAPTDDAFAALPDGALDGLLADPQALTRVLTYHVVPGRITAAEIADVPLTTLEGGTLAIEVGDGVRVDEATVVSADVKAGNGVIHVIDTVLMP